MYDVRITDYMQGSNNYYTQERIPTARYTYSKDEIYNDSQTNESIINKLYRNSDSQYCFGSWVVRPIIDTLLYFTGMPKVGSKDKKFNKVIANVYEQNASDILSIFRETGLYGQLGVLVTFDDELKLPVFSLKTTKTILDVRKENPDNANDITYVKLRDVFTRVNELGQEETYYWDKEFFKEFKNKLNKDTKKKESIVEYYYAITETKEGDGSHTKTIRAKTINPLGCIPYVEFSQNKLSTDVNGHSDVTGMLEIISAYHQTFETMLDSNMYNGKPVLVFTGLNNSKQFVETMYGEINTMGNVVESGYYETFGSYYLEDNGNVRYLEAPNVVANSKTILELLFYIFVQISGVPEWALGAHINGTWASARMQSIPLIQKVEGKRNDFKSSLMKLNYVIAKFYEVFDNQKISDYTTTIDWNEIIEEDRDYILRAIQTALPLEVLSKETILKLLDIVSDPEGEIEKANSERETNMGNLNKKSVINNVKSKLGEVTSDGNFDVKMVNDVLTKLFGENYLDELGMEDEEE